MIRVLKKRTRGSEYETVFGSIDFLGWTDFTEYKAEDVHRGFSWYNYIVTDENKTITTFLLDEDTHATKTYKSLKQIKFTGDTYTILGSDEKIVVEKTIFDENINPLMRSVQNLELYPKYLVRVEFSDNSFWVKPAHSILVYSIKPQEQQIQELMSVFNPLLNVDKLTEADFRLSSQTANTAPDEPPPLPPPSDPPPKD